MFETNQFPKVKAYVLNGQIQASAVLHCIHSLVECATTGCLLRFRSCSQDRRKSRPWIWRRRQLASKHLPPHIRRCPKKKGHHHSSYSPFIPFSSALKKVDPLRDLATEKLMDSALESLLPLLNRATSSPFLIFALRVGLSLTCTSRKRINLWGEAKRAMVKYLLVDEAGLKPRILGFVAPSNIWQDRPWDRLNLDSHYLVRRFLSELAL